MSRQKLEVSDVSYGTIQFVTLKQELLQLLQPYFQTEFQTEFQAEPSARSQRSIDCRPGGLPDRADEA